MAEALRRDKLGIQQAGAIPHRICFQRWPHGHLGCETSKAQQTIWGACWGGMGGGACDGRSSMNTARAGDGFLAPLMPELNVLTCMWGPGKSAIHPSIAAMGPGPN